MFLYDRPIYRVQQLDGFNPYMLADLTELVQLIIAETPLLTEWRTFPFKGPLASASFLAAATASIPVVAKATPPARNVLIAVLLDMFSMYSNLIVNRRQIYGKSDIISQDVGITSKNTTFAYGSHSR